MVVAARVAASKITRIRDAHPHGHLAVTTACLDHSSHRTVRMRTAMALMFVLGLVACTVGEGELPPGSDEPSDYEVQSDDGKGDGISATFDQHQVVSDEVFLDKDSLTVEDIQAFFEDSPYKNRSWLADYKTPEGKSAAQALFDEAKANEISPLMLLARMQVEAGLVSKTSTPSTTRINSALGCGCPDGSGCAAQYKGFSKQLECGAKILKKWYAASVDGTGHWKVGQRRRTLDPKYVTPKNHATASLYAYTPWVLINQGGNWLVWNVTRKFLRHAEAKGFIQPKTTAAR